MLYINKLIGIAKTWFSD